MDGSNLIELADRLDRLHGAFEAEHGPALRNIAEKAAAFGKCWSGSNLGYHALVYHRGFSTPPPGMHFSAEWGHAEQLFDGGTVGEWCEYQEADVLRRVHTEAGDPDQGQAHAASDRLAVEVRKAQPEIVSVLAVAIRDHDDPYLRKLQDKVEKITIADVAEFARSLMPHGQLSTRDALAASQGLRVAPHQQVMVKVVAYNHPSLCARELADIARQAGSHLVRLVRQTRRSGLVGTNVFIGHGRSPAWLLLKDFVKDRLGLPYD